MLRRRLLVDFSGSLLAAAGLVLGCNQGGELEQLDWQGAAAAEETSGQGGLGGEPPLRLAASSDEQELSLPFAVDEHFVPFGYMGEPVSVFDDPNQCFERVEGAQGRCHAFSFLATSDDSWRGLYWLSDFNNWGTSPGRRIMSGARQVSFVAKSSIDGLQVFFLVGGIESETAQEDSSQPRYEDSFQVRVPIVLNSEFQRYTLDLSGSQYPEGVLGGFGWGLFNSQPGRIWIDDVRWE